MRLPSPLIVWLLFTHAAFCAEPARPDLTGTWNLTSQKSQQYIGRSGIASLTISKEGLRFVFTDIAVYADGQTRESYEVTPDGTWQPMPTGSISAHWEGSVLVICSRSSSGDLTETWRLQPTFARKALAREVTAVEHVRGKDILVFERQELYSEQ